MNNIKNNVIIVLLVLIFIGYFYLENNVFNYKNIKKNVEGFEQSSNQIQTIIKNVFFDFKLINNNLDKLLKERIKILNIIKENNFVFVDIAIKSKIKKHMNVISSILNTNNNIYNNIINYLGNMPNVNYLLKLKNLFTAYKDLDITYKDYYNSNFSFSESNTVENEKILNKKIDIEKLLIIHHGNINYLISSISSNLFKEGLTKDMNDFLLQFLKYEEEKNNLLKNILETSSIFVQLKLFNEIHKENKEINIEHRSKIDKALMIKKEKINIITKILGEENNFIEDGINFKINELELKNKEIEYLYSANNNDNMLSNFCKKIKKLDKPSEGNLISKRLHKDFKKKKQQQIDKLEKKIDKMINYMTDDQITKFNSYILRTNDQASKQIEAIKKAKDNLENAKKFKINVS